MQSNPHLKDSFSLKYFKAPVLLWAIFTLYFSFQFIPRLSVGILKEDIIARYGIDTIIFGQIVGCYYLGYAGIQIPIGIMLDKYNLKYITVLSILTTVLGILIFLMATEWKYLVFGRFLMGIGSAAGFLSVVKVVNLFFSPTIRPIMISFSFTFGLVGAIFGGTPMKLIFNHFGYDIGFIILAIFGFILACSILIIKDRKIKSFRKSTQDSISTSAIVKIALNSRILIVGLSGGLLMGFGEGFAGVWSIPFFQQVYGISLENSILISSFVPLGMCFGSPILVLLTEYLKSINLVIFLVGTLMILAYILMFLYIDWSLQMIATLMFVLGILCCYQVLLCSLLNNIVKDEFIGTAIAVMNCLKMSLGYFFHVVISYLMYNNGIENISTLGTRFTYKSFAIGLSIIPISCILGLLGFLYLELTKNKS